VTPNDADALINLISEANDRLQKALESKNTMEKLVTLARFNDASQSDALPLWFALGMCRIPDAQYYRPVIALPMSTGTGWH